MKRTREQYLETVEALTKLARQTEQGGNPKLQKIGNALHHAAKTKQARAEQVGKTPRRSRKFGN